MRFLQFKITKWSTFPCRLSNNIMCVSLRVYNTPGRTTRNYGDPWGPRGYFEWDFCSLKSQNDLHFHVDYPITFVCVSIRVYNTPGRTTRNYGVPRLFRNAEKPKLRSFLAQLLCYIDIRYFPLDIYVLRVLNTNQLVTFHLCLNKSIKIQDCC